ncbi:MAG: DUF2971 domain-containing protein [bacterium]
MKLISKDHLEKIIREDLKRILSTDIVFKYSDFDTGLNKILLQQSLKFSNPNDFNDPFDSHENLINIKHDKKLVDEVLRNSELNSIFKITRKERRKLEKDIFKKEIYQPILRKKRNEYKLSCFSAMKDVKLMWSHYADKHQGMCIGFNFPHRYDERFLLCPVKYVKKIIPHDGTADIIRTILYMQTTKTKEWEYEDEIRAITIAADKSQSFEIVFYEKKYVREIIFGCKVPNQNITDAIKKLKDNNFDISSIEFKKMEKDRNTLLLKENKVDYDF